MDMTENQILASIAPPLRETVLEHCQSAMLVAETPLAEAGETVDTVYFPESSVISIVSTYHDGATIEVANVGREGCTGVGLVLGNSQALISSVVQVSGQSLTMSSKTFSHLKRTIPEFEVAINASVQGLIYQVMVSGACNIRHGTKQRLARWLMTMCNRSGGDVIDLTQDFLAEILGVRRATISQSLADLRARSMINNARGRIEIIDHEGLHRECCECYDMVRNAYDRLYQTVPGQ
ncbi:MAG: Crp/Fnr family transcriptional regulator [Rhodobacteraceae bacterium]|nr:MAG: Crp/Fnr family transcriptional regulator [Paracoccaceae bacterium]